MQRYMQRYIIHKNGRVVGGMALSARRADILERAGYRLLPAGVDR